MYQGLLFQKADIQIKNVKLFVLNSTVSAKTNKNGKFILKKVQSNDSIVIQINNDSYASFLLGDNDSFVPSRSKKTARTLGI